MDKRFAEMERVPTTGWDPTAWSGAGTTNVKNITVQMFEPQHPSHEEALFQALGSPRVAA